MKLLMLMTLTAAYLAAADLPTKWVGAMKLPTGPDAIIHLTLRQQGETISGSLGYQDETRQTPIEKPELHADQLTFEVHDNADRVITFRLTLKDGSLSGEARFADRVLETRFSPVGPAQRVGNGVTAPILLRKTEPVFSEEARAAKLQGTVLLYVQVNPDGIPINIRVLRSLGLGLDENAMDAVKLWQFKPGMKDGQPVTVEAQIEVNFRL